jgi:CheY-like chemotaxis protein
MFRTDTAPPRVLIIDQVAERATSLSLLLRTLSCKTSVGFDARAGIRLAQLFRPTLVFISLGLEDDGAYQVLNEIKVIQGPKCALFVAMDVAGSHATSSRCLDAGFNWIVGPTLEPDVLNQMLDATIAHRETVWERSLTGRRLEANPL